MQTVLHEFVIAWAWIAAHPYLTVFGLWTVTNVLWAQLPKPKNPKVSAVWDWTHAVLQLVVTHKAEPGTFTWPSLARLLIAAMAETDQKDKDKTPPGG